uniref:Uncharacterized protein n=1 Tax=Pipistrellus kuhlii TaxID=59472 RepID=A0A7J7XAV7_PIPKU|nr:hypothetical protein mPipKuh1_010585 [Pipistrellus kuhlii]
MAGSVPSQQHNSEVLPMLQPVHLITQPWRQAQEISPLGLALTEAPIMLGLLSFFLFFKTYFIDFFFFFFFFFLQRGRESDRELETLMRERNIDQLLPAHLPRGMCPQPRYMPLTGIKPGTFQSAGRRSIH